MPRDADLHGDYDQYESPAGDTFLSHEAPSKGNWV